jgi:hypothetical protein
MTAPTNASSDTPMTTTRKASSIDPIVARRAGSFVEVRLLLTRCRVRLPIVLLTDQSI